mgnify:CR=1 FL=1
MTWTADTEVDTQADTEAEAPVQLRLDLDGFEGPIDLLLQLARERKVDITQIPILDLAEQYLAFIQAARRLRLDLAADYLVMAAWLAYLKSRLLLPDPVPEEEAAAATGEEMAAALRFQLRRLQALRDNAEALLRRPRLGIDVFPRGAPESAPAATTVVRFDCTLYALLRAYADQVARRGAESLRVDPLDLESVDSALARLRRQLPAVADWRELARFLPPAPTSDPLRRRAAYAASFAASLELCREGAVELRQDRSFGPIYLRRRRDAPEGGAG